MTLADYVEDENIDFICFDANEPEIDEGDVYKNTYFFQLRNKDKGARAFFEGLDINGLKDGWTSQGAVEKALPISHVIKVKKSLRRRYDYIFCRKEFKVEKMKYLYEEALEVGGDHAMLVMDVEI